MTTGHGRRWAWLMLAVGAGLTAAAPERAARARPAQKAAPAGAGIVIELGLSRRLGATGSTFYRSESRSPRRYPVFRTRALSRANPARPYIERLISFSRPIRPSTGPLLHGSPNPARTAASSWRIDRDSPRNSGTPLASARSSHAPNSCPIRARTIPANCSVNTIAAHTAPPTARSRSTRRAARSSRSQGRRTTSNDRRWAVGTCARRRIGPLARDRPSRSVRRRIAEP
jgi:hypothetical protein